MSDTEKKISNELTKLWHEVANTSFHYTHKDLEETQIKLNLLKKLCNPREHWNLYFIQALLCFHREEYRAAYTYLKQSVKVRGSEFVEAQNLELLIKTEAVRKRKLSDKYRERPWLFTAIFYILALIGAGLFGWTGIAKLPGEIGIAVLLVFFCAAIATIIRWTTAEKWGLGAREILSKTSIVIAATVLLMLPVVIVLAGPDKVNQTPSSKAVEN